MTHKHRFKTTIEIINNEPIYYNKCRSCDFRFESTYYTKTPNNIK